MNTYNTEVLVNHDGSKHKPGEILLGIPSSIEPLVSATTTVGKRITRYTLLFWRLFESFIIWILWLVVCMLVILLVYYFTNLQGDELFYLAFIIPVFPVFRHLINTRWTDRTTYVGRRGLAVVEMKKGIVTSNELLFSDVTYAEIGELQYKGRYFRASWHDKWGKVFEIKGYYMLKPNTISDYHFFLKAVQAWNNYEARDHRDVNDHGRQGDRDG